MNRPFTLLLADDSPDDVFLLQHAFEKSGAEPAVHSVSDGLEAIAYLNGDGAYGDRRAHPFPHLLLLDLNMPRCNGFEVLAWLKQQPQLSWLPAHVLTASARPADVQRAYELGARSYVVKPTRIDDLVAFASALFAWLRFVVAPPHAAMSTSISNPSPSRAAAP